MINPVTAARQSGVSTRTIHRWLQSGHLLGTAILRDGQVIPAVESSGRLVLAYRVDEVALSTIHRLRRGRKYPPPSTTI